MSKVSGWLVVFVTLTLGLLVGGLFALIAYTGNEGAKREQQQVMTCLVRGGTWVDQWEACVYGQTEAPR